MKLLDEVTEIKLHDLLDKLLKILMVFCDITKSGDMLIWVDHNYESETVHFSQSIFQLLQIVLSKYFFATMLYPLLS